MSTLRTTAMVVAALVGGLFITLPAASAGESPSTSDARTHVIADCVHRTIKPRRVVGACADDNEYAVVKRYGSWGTHQAWGSGRFHMNDCEPTCAGGTVRSYPATFRFHRLVQTRKGPLFTRLGVTYLQGGEEHNVEIPLPRRPLTDTGADMARVRGLRAVCC